MTLILLVLEHLAGVRDTNRTNVMPHQDSVFQGLVKLVPWDEFDRLVETYGSDVDARRLRSKDQFLAMLYAQLSGAASLREIETGLQSHATQLYHLGGRKIARSTLAEANNYRPADVFSGLFSALLAQFDRGWRRKVVGDAVRLIDSSGLPLNGLSRNWASFSTGVCGAKMHIIYDPDADCPIYAAVTPAKVNDITAAKEMPIEPGATYVFDLGYYDFGWWAKLHAAGCRIVTRLKANTRLSVVEERTPPPNSCVLSDQVGHLPERLAASRKNPMPGLVREVRVFIETGKVLRIFTNDLEASAEKIAALYKRRWAIELFFRWVKQTLKIRHFFGTSQNAIRIQIAVALIAFLLLRLVQQANNVVDSPLAFARLIRANLMHRKAIPALLETLKPPTVSTEQTAFVFDDKRATSRLKTTQRIKRAA
jgi:IS4 transposase